jgi:serine/threonine-protein kinase
LEKESGIIKRTNKVGSKLFGSMKKPGEPMPQPAKVAGNPAAGNAGSVMTPARWSQIREIFSEVMSKPKQERAPYLDKACGTDDPLRREVENLLAHQDSTSLLSPMADLLNCIAGAEVAPGQMLAQYRIEEKLGEGGMGAVYRAYDTRLHREVAVKVLPPEHLADPESRKRLILEARAASALNHANIVTVYEIETERGVDFIAMEYVEGRSLAHEIPANGLPVARLLTMPTRLRAHWPRRMLPA